MRKHRISINVFSVTAITAGPEDARRAGIESWSLKALSQVPQKLSEEELLASPFITGLRETLRSVGAHRALAPHVAPSSARIVDPCVLTRRISLGNGMSIRRNKDIPADGIILGKGRAFVMSGAGCPVIVASDGYDVIVAHAGRDSLVDRGAVTGKPAREHVSVVDAVVGAFVDRGAIPNGIEMCMLFSIPSGVFEHRLDHEVYGDYNRALAVFVSRRWGDGIINGPEESSFFLDLECLFEEQAFQAGVSNAWSMYSLGEFPELAHTRDGKGSERRNLVVIKRDH